jgi:hypothetical protein
MQRIDSKMAILASLAAAFKRVPETARKMVRESLPPVAVARQPVKLNRHQRRAIAAIRRKGIKPVSNHALTKAALMHKPPEE